MASRMIKLPLVSLLAVMATAMPAVERSDEIVCPHDYIVEKWGHVLIQPTYNFTRGVGTFRGCAPETVRRDDPAYDTTVEINDDAFTESWYPDSDPNTVRTTPAHEELIGRALEVCGNTYCDGQKSIETSAGRQEGSTLKLALDGNFADSTLRDNFLALIKDALDKSVAVTSELDGQIMTGQGARFLHARSGYGPASGYYLTARITEEDASQSCPDVVNTINGFGALVPELSPVFGLAAAVCGAVSS